MAGGPPPGLRPVAILGLPLDVYQRASEHNDELLREFALIRGDDSSEVPSLIEELQGRFGTCTEGPARALRAALVRGDKEIDLHDDVPSGVADAAAGLGALLDEADDFCRSGNLLTLAARPESLAFRRWYLGEFVSQIAGRPPRCWSAVMGGGPGTQSAVMEGGLGG